MRVHRQWAKGERPHPNNFVNRDGAMSVDWALYSTAAKTRERKNGGIDQAVVSFCVKSVRAVPGQTVVHAPDEANDNRAHTHVHGDKDEEVRVKLSRLAIWEIMVDDPIG